MNSRILHELEMGGVLDYGEDPVLPEVQAPTVWKQSMKPLLPFIHSFTQLLFIRSVNIY